jgi:SpoVK/Ycf46/Vps4 family AAA+-type ATPase
MGIEHTEVAATFSAAHFASEYERYAALLMARLARVGAPMVAHAFAHWERRELLALPRRAAEVQHRYRLDVDEIEPTVQALREREAALVAMGGFGAPVFRNVAMLGDALALDTAERALLVFAVVAESVSSLRELLDNIGAHVRDRPSAARTLGCMLALDPQGVQQALDPHATLAQSGLVRLNLHDSDARFLTAREGLAAILFDEFDARERLFAQFAHAARVPTLAPADFSHLGEDFAVLSALLTNAVRRREAGINVMLYGPPGTGKTELARVLARAAGLSLYEIRHSADDGEDMARARYSQVVVAQRLMRAAREVVLLFDETEDVLPRYDERSAGATGQRLGKAAFNDLLESNPVPTIWVSNAIGHIDPAYLRRFAFLLEVKKPSRTIRRRIVERVFGPLGAGAAWMDRMAAHGEAAPGQLAQAARVARLVSGEFESASVGERVLRNGMRALGQRPAAADEAPAAFALDYLNCNIDVAALVAGLAARPAGGALFLGPPGTGKTALARHIAEAADRPLMVKRASDLLSPWVGVGETNIALAFEEATAERAVLMLDEAESFLADRRAARARWELTETNELLTQMERFEGLFVCTTNLIDRLDRAALRRFAVKVQFGFLRPAQLAGLIGATLDQLGVAAMSRTEQDEAGRLTRATPGDIAAVAKRFRMLGERPSAAAFVRALAEEIALKDEGGAYRMGF